MPRTIACFALALALVGSGCSWMRAPNAGPFAKNKKTPPPPYGSVAPEPIAKGPQANQSPLGIAYAEPTPPLPPDDPSLVPPKADLKLAGATEPTAQQPAPKKSWEGAWPPGYSGEGERPVKNAAIKDVLATANGAWAKVTTYELTLTRCEINPRGDAVRDTVLFQYRREPMALYTRTLDGNSNGRESVYNPSKFGDKLHLKLGVGDHPVFKAGFVAPAMSPDDPKVTEKARYSVREIGHGKMIARLEAALAKLEAGKSAEDALATQYGVKRPEWPDPLACVTHRLARGDDPVMPAGGTRVYFFDTKPGSPSFGLPVLVTATDPSGKEVEFYLFEKWKNPANLTDADFDPARLKRK
jgi:hypothetical protein